MTGYRPEIDGLRAVAIIPVVLFHFNVAGLAGGFVGVDIFFVISGFLIGGILWKELCETGKVRLVRFFLRRIRRLAPAYYAMAFASFIAGWFILLPFEFREFGKELIAATVYLSNVFFWREAGYFDVLGEERILLHTWSLSVEEQFYVFLPLFLVALARFRQIIPLLLLLIGAVALAACIYVTQIAHTTAFYLFPFRAWELLAGVLLAIYGQERGFEWRVHASLSWIGLGLIALAIVLLEPGETFPGAGAILPVLGAALLIANGKHDNPINRVLTTKLFLFFGAISYSLYLWHWPVITFANYATGHDLSLIARIGLIALSMGLAWVSLHLVENPVRRSTVRPISLFGGYVLASAVALGGGALLFLKDGLIERFDPATRPFITATRDFHQDWSRCTTPADGPFVGTEICPIGPEGAPRLLVWGDSHARAFKEGIEQAAFDADTPGLLIWRGGCPPVVGLAKDETANTRFEDEACTQHNTHIAAALEDIPSLERVLLVGRWAYYAEGQGVGRDAENLVTLAPTETAEFTGDTAPELLAGALQQTISLTQNAGLETFVMRQAPELFEFSARESARALAYGQETLEEIAETSAMTTQSDLVLRNEQVAPILSGLDVPVIDPWPLLCNADRCNALHDGKVYYFDNNHVTNTAAIAIRSIFQPVFR